MCASNANYSFSSFFFFLVYFPQNAIRANHSFLASPGMGKDGSFIKAACTQVTYSKAAVQENI
jgi:hypothetical protein